MNGTDSHINNNSIRKKTDTCNTNFRFLALTSVEDVIFYTI